MASFLTGSLKPYMWVPTIFLKTNSMMLFIKENIFCMENEKQGRPKMQETSKIQRTLD